jgi:arylamine N-acetyltransferase
VCGGAYRLGVVDRKNQIDRRMVKARKYTHQHKEFNMTASIYSMNKSQAIAYQLGNNRIVFYRDGHKVTESKIDGVWRKSLTELGSEFVEQVRRAVKA